MTDVSEQSVAGSAAFADDLLAALVGRGCKVACPACGRRAMSQSDSLFHSSGIGQHMRTAHPDLADRVVAASRRLARIEKARIAAEQQEARQRPLRSHIVTGAFLDEVVGELRSLIGMMEPYYSQCDSATRDTYELIGRIEAMHSAALLAAPRAGEGK